MAVEASEQQQLNVFSVGLGTAGIGLHGKLWDSLPGYDIQRYGFDTNPERLQRAADLGITVVSDLVELPDVLEGKPLHIIDNTTSSGEHGQSTRDVLDVITEHNVTLPVAWLLEKPVVSGADELVVMSSALDEIGRERVFVNENYLASKAVVQGRQIIEAQAAAGNPVTDILVSFAKDRVPDVVLTNRFTDQKGLAVYGIEMPHQLAIASALLGKELATDDDLAIVENRYLHDIDGIEESEGNLTVIRQDGVTVTMRQGLGPFEFTEQNQLVRRAFDWRNKEAERYARVRFANDALLIVRLDPVAGIDRYHSQVELREATGANTRYQYEDNNLRNLIGDVARFAISGGSERTPLLDQLAPDRAIRFAQQLAELRVNAGDPVRVPSLDDFAVGYRQTLATEQALRAQKN